MSGAAVYHGMVIEPTPALRVRPTRSGIGPTEVPLRPLCPACGAERVGIHTLLSITFDVVAPVAQATDLQVVDHRSDGQGWEDDDRACCGACGWHGTVRELQAETASAGACDRSAAP